MKIFDDADTDETIENIRAGRPIKGSMTLEDLDFDLVPEPESRQEKKAAPKAEASGKLGRTDLERAVVEFYQKNPDASGSEVEQFMMSKIGKK